MNPKCLKIALIGTRGVPANYGGFETCVEEVGRRLTEKNHSVAVYCRKSYYQKKPLSYKGMHLVHLPNLPYKSLDTLSHTFLSVLHAINKNYDIYMIFNAANSICLIPLAMLKKKIIINTDGIEWQRSKWNFLGKIFYRLSEFTACAIATRLISDSPGIKAYYLKNHNTDSVEIAYGAYLQKSKNVKKLSHFDIEKDQYFLQITRFEKENHPLKTINEFKKLKTNKKLIIVGGNPYRNKYTEKILNEASDTILLPGYIYNKDLLRELWCNCFAYVHGNSVGGTNPALLQAMASGSFTIAVLNEFNLNVLKDCGIYYNADDHSLSRQMQWAIENTKKLKIFKLKARKRIERHYSWDNIASEYESLFYRTISCR